MIEAVLERDGRVDAMLSDSVPYMVQALSRLLSATFVASIADLNITLAQARIIMMLDADAPLSQIELSRRLDIGRSTVGQTLAVMEARGIVERVRSEDDRRIIVIRLTEHGLSLPAPLRQAAKDQAAALRRYLGNDYTSLFHTILVKALAFAVPGDDPDQTNARRARRRVRVGEQNSPAAAVNHQVLSVQRVQVGLQYYGYYLGVPDGIVGARTRRALRKFQADYGLKVTGTITPEVLAQFDVSLR